MVDKRKAWMNQPKKKIKKQKRTRSTATTVEGRINHSDRSFNYSGYSVNRANGVYQRRIDTLREYNRQYREELLDIDRISMGANPLGDEIDMGDLQTHRSRQNKRASIFQAVARNIQVITDLFDKVNENEIEFNEVTSRRTDLN